MLHICHAASVVLAWLGVTLSVSLPSSSAWPQMRIPLSVIVLPVIVLCHLMPIALTPIVETYLVVLIVSPLLSM
jgi:hypothetical protein